MQPAANYSYTPRGHLERVQEAQSPNTVLFQNVGANARGQIEKAYLGDGSRTTRGFIKNTARLEFTNAAAGTPQVQNFVYGYDAVGNVSGRADLLNTVSETFGYDALDRLTTSTVTNGTGPHPVTYAYDDAAGNLGNMTHKSDLSTLPSASMSYSTTARPHALTTLNTGSGTRNFVYNANGALTDGQVASTTRTLQYTSYDLLASATIGTTSRTFSYGPDRKRYRQSSVSGTTRTYTYIGEHYVKEVEGATTEHKLYIIANGEPVAYVSDDGSPETRYLHKDHLGSITTIVTNQNVAGREKLSYDAWGKRRHGTDWWSAPATATEERGYTGHEHLDNMTLIHMNGRVYDPQLARFTSPDPFVTAPLFSQSYNRYAYVYGNPLKYIDPSGFGPSTLGPGQCEQMNLDCSGDFAGWVCAAFGCLEDFVPWDGGLVFAPREDPTAAAPEPEVPPPAPPPEIPPPVPSATGPGPGNTDTGGLTPVVTVDPLISTESLGVMAQTGEVLPWPGTWPGVEGVKEAVKQAGRRLGAKAIPIIGTLVDAAVASRTDEDKWYYYHGTSQASAAALLAGAPLLADVAISQKIDGPPGFFLASNYVAAEYYATRYPRAPGGILQYGITESARNDLMLAGSVERPIPVGQNSPPAATVGTEFVVPPTAFALFDTLRQAGRITVTPAIDPGP